MRNTFITTVALRDSFLRETLVIGCILFALKLMIIQYGMPYMVHVDEAMISTDPLKIMLGYSAGDFSKSTNLYNWFLLFWTGCIFVLGQVFGWWHGVDSFKTYLIAFPEEVVLWGRILSVVLSTLAAVILIRLVCSITGNRTMRWLLSCLIVFNPLELNSVNWVKFDAAAYLVYAVVLYLGYHYFVLRREGFRWPVYLALYAGIGVRIEMVMYVAGFLLSDFLLTYRQGVAGVVRRLFWPQVGGVVLYLVVTLTPLTLFHTSAPTTDSLTTSPTFQQAIWEKLPSWSHLVDVLGSSPFYLYALVSTLGPLVIYFAFGALRGRQWFILIPFVINCAMLCVFPIKQVHYLLSVSVLIMVGAILFISGREYRTAVRLAVVGVLWSGSLYAYESYQLLWYGDVRLSAREYLLEHTQPEEKIYVEGVFSAIYDKRERYALRAKASRESGSTGLSNEYFSQSLDDQDTRFVTQVSNWEPFSATAYENLFTNRYDTAMLRRDRPVYYVYVAPRTSANMDDLERMVFPEYHRNVLQNYHLEKTFDYPIYDPRVRYSNFYYFHRVSVYRINS